MSDTSSENSIQSDDSSASSSSALDVGAPRSSSRFKPDVDADDHQLEITTKIALDYLKQKAWKWLHYVTILCVWLNIRQVFAMVLYLVQSPFEYLGHLQFKLFTRPLANTYAILAGIDQPDDEEAIAIRQRILAKAIRSPLYLVPIGLGVFIAYLLLSSVEEAVHHVAIRDFINSLQSTQQVYSKHDDGTAGRYDKGIEEIIDELNDQIDLVIKLKASTEPDNIQNHREKLKEAWDAVFGKDKNALSPTQQILQTISNELFPEENAESENEKRLLTTEDIDNINNGGLTSKNPALKLLVDASVKKYYQQDVLRKPDYALFSLGGRIVRLKTSPTYYHNTILEPVLLNFFGLQNWKEGPDLAIDANTEVGDCWSMRGAQGRLMISLGVSIYLEGVVLDFPLAKVHSSELESAPRSFRVFGYRDYPRFDVDGVFLGQFEYQISLEDIQVFTFARMTGPYKFVSFHFDSNWGNPNFTNIYRVRVQGKQALY